MPRRVIDATVAGIAGGVLATSTIRGIELVPAIVQGVFAGLIVGVLVGIVTYRGESKLSRRVRTGGR